MYISLYTSKYYAFLSYLYLVLYPSIPQSIPISINLSFYTSILLYPFVLLSITIFDTSITLSFYTSNYPAIPQSITPSLFTFIPLITILSFYTDNYHSIYHHPSILLSQVVTNSTGFKLWPYMVYNVFIHFKMFLCVFLFVSWLLGALLTTNFLYQSVGQTVCSHTRDSDSLLVTQTLGLPSYSNHLSLALYSCYLMKFLYNMTLLPSNAHSDVINQHCGDLPVLCRALIVLLLMISGNMHIHPGPSTVASPNSDLCSDICFTDFCSCKSLGFLHVNTIT